MTKLDFDVIHAKLELTGSLYDICRKALKLSETTKKQATFVDDAIHRNPAHVSQQQIDDVNLEMDRLSRMILLDKLTLCQPALKEKSAAVTDVLLAPRRYTEEADADVKKRLEELRRMAGSALGITEEERRQVVAAVGLKRGHWFKCPNGHVYAIGECGGAMQQGTCNECGARIGGAQHRLLPGQSLATEMDGARHAAWSDAANLANYQLPFD